jgi:hypothetical protein
MHSEFRYSFPPLWTLFTLEATALDTLIEARPVKSNWVWFTKILQTQTQTLSYSKQAMNRDTEEFCVQQMCLSFAEC